MNVMELAILLNITMMNYLLTINSSAPFYIINPVIQPEYHRSLSSCFPASFKFIYQSI